MSEREKTESGWITSDENLTETGVKHEKNITGSWTLYTILCKCLFSEVTVQAVTELDNKAAHCHTPVPQWHRPFL